jgi:pyruvate formate lyase activating enzyme
MVFSDRCLAECNDCISLCPLNALSKSKKSAVLDRSRCNGCGLCAVACPSEALQSVGRAVTVAEVMRELAKDADFYQDSGGGVTFSGGEPLQQCDFLQALLVSCQEQGWHTAVDTSGHAPFGAFAKILPLTDLFLYDLKIVDPDKHQRYTGVANHLLLANLVKLSPLARSLAIRVPLVPGCNDSLADMEQMADFCARLPRLHPVHLLPYHRGGSGKSERLDRTDRQAGIRPPTAAKVQKIKEIFLARKLPVKIGG